MSATTVRSGRLHSKLHYRLQRYVVEGACLLLGFVLLVWSITPLYNMWLIALDSHEAIFSGGFIPSRRRWRPSASSSIRTSGILSVSGISSATASLSACR